MATATRRISPADHGQRLALDEFIAADFQEGWLYELARGVIVVTNVPGVPHAQIVSRLWRLFGRYDDANPGIILLQAGGGECRLRLPGMQSDRHPDQAIYLTPAPSGKDPWMRWTPEIVVEVVSRGSKRRDYRDKREEYLRAGIAEYWIVDPPARKMLVLQRAGDAWEEVPVTARGTYRTRLLPCLAVRPADLLGGPGDD